MNVLWINVLHVGLWYDYAKVEIRGFENVEIVRFDIVNNRRALDCQRMHHETHNVTTLENEVDGALGQVM